MVPDDFLQSSAWEEFQKRLGAKCLRVFLDKDNSILIIKKKLFFDYYYLYAPRCKFFNNLDKFIGKISEIAKKERAIFLKIEPIDELLIEKKAGFATSGAIQPAKTLLLDLSKSENNLFQNIARAARYSIKTAEKRGVKIRKSENIGEFYEMFRITALKNKIRIYPQNYFENLLNLQKNEIKTEIFIAELDEKPIAAAIILFYKQSAFYLYAASAIGYGRFNAPSLVLWEVIKLAKAQGVKIFDFWGIENEENKKWAGFTAFKKSFGGREYEYPAAVDYVFDRKFYLAYKILKFIKSIF